MNLLVTHGFEPNYTLGFAKGLAANNVSLFVLSSDDTETQLTAAGIQNWNIRGSQSDSRGAGAKMLGLTLYYYRLLLSVFRHRGGTIHFTGIFRNELILFECLVVNFWLRLGAKRYIYTAHNILPHSRQRSFLFAWIYRLIYRTPDIIIVHTDEARKELVERFGVPDARIRVISIGLNEEVPVTAITREDARGMLGYDNNAKLVLFFGRIDEYKGLHILVDAFSGLDGPDCRLLVAGDIRNPNYAKKIGARVLKSPRAADIRLDLRMIPNSEIEIFFKAADVLCLPYLNITQSGLIFLAAAFGLPVVATDVGSIANFVTPETGLITKTNDAKGVATELVRLFGSLGNYQRDRIRQLGRKYAWDRICIELIPLYEQPMSKGLS
jgi:glycosyltransferase involved in cell wall biosynthesis